MKFEKNDNLQVFEGLLNGGYIDNDSYKDTYYISYADKVLEDLDNDIKEGKISYKDISIFYSKEKENELKEEEKLISRLKIIALNSNDKSNNDYNNNKYKKYHSTNYNTGYSKNNQNEKYGGENEKEKGKEKAENKKKKTKETKNKEKEKEKDSNNQKIVIKTSGAKSLKELLG